MSWKLEFIMLSCFYASLSYERAAIACRRAIPPYVFFMESFHGPWIQASLGMTWDHAKLECHDPSKAHGKISSTWHPVPWSTHGHPMTYQAHCSYTGCSLSIVFLRRFKNIVLTLAFLGFPSVSVCVHWTQVKQQSCSRTGRQGYIFWPFLCKVKNREEFERLEKRKGKGEKRRKKGKNDKKTR